MASRPCPETALELEEVTIVDPRPDPPLRVSDPLLFILASLADGPKHGYHVMKDVATLSGNAVPTGKIYGSLAMLRQEELIEALPNDGRRRPYRLTPAGKLVLRQQLEEIRCFVLTTLERLPS